MTINVSKPAINVREKLAELDKPTGIAGEAMLRAETPQEQFNLIGAGRRNLIINGAMQVWQRGTSAKTAPNGYSTVDRWKIYESSEGAYTSELSTEHPTESGYSLKCQVTTADTSIGSAQYAFVETNLEGQNVQQVQYGTSNAKHVTVSFWVKSNKIGTYCVALYKFAGSGTAYMYRKEYTINSANTWEKKTITIPPLTKSGGKVPNTSGSGFQLAFGFAWGSNFQGTDNVWDTATSGYGTSNQVNWMDSTSNNFYLAEVQLELGKVATPFEHRSYGEELALCQRYYQKYAYNNNYEASGFTGIAYTTARCYFTGRYDVPMRTKPTMVANNMRVDWFSTGQNQTGYGLDNATSKLAAFFYLDVASGNLTIGDPYHAIADTSGSSYLAFDAEL